MGKIFEECTLPLNCPTLLTCLPRMKMKMARNKCSVLICTSFCINVRERVCCILNGEDKPTSDIYK